MKINEYASSLAKREGKKESLSVAQISEVLKIVNQDLWGIPYFLVKIKRGVPLACLSVFILSWVGLAIVADACLDDTLRPVAIIEVTSD